MMFGALAHGLPQLVLPQGADQFLNGPRSPGRVSGVVLNGAEATTVAI